MSAAAPSERDHAEELALAAACARGERTALADFDARFGREVEASLRRMRLLAATVDDARQRVYQHLFVAPPGGRARIADYQGRGDLRSWLKVVTVRCALNLLRERDSAVLDEKILSLVSAPGDDPELELMKRAYREEFRAAFADALAALPTRERAVLRQLVVDGSSLEEIGVLHGVHRTTAMRWVEQAQATLLTQTRKRLLARLRVDADELDSILRLVQSRLSVTLT